MPKNENLDEFVNRLRIERANMPKRLRSIADAMIQRPADLALMSIPEIARSLEASPSALVRFAKAMGYEGFAPMQKVLRQDFMSETTNYRERSKGIGTPSQGVESEVGYVFDAFTSANISAIERAQSEMDVQAIGRGVELLRKARLIGVIGQRRSFPLAAYLYYGLTRLNEDAILLDCVGGMSEPQISPLGAKDALCVISFAPYAEQAVAIAQEAKKRGCKILAITDNAKSPLAKLATESIFVDESNLNNIRAIAVTSVVIQTIFVSLGKDVR
ncbi:MurR/RpiR family transcriptional regulator [Falsihalocynthiibacter sp. SS001]|uniref:MurR/RpiR family transcriptional regulator n=1 Tax=Falsihalocynthiibacter sp. SS001 TaxID=3349698 RepID=UPI0036D30561